MNLFMYFASISFLALASGRSLAAPTLLAFEKSPINFTPERVSCQVWLDIWPSGMIEFDLGAKTYYALDDATQCDENLLGELDQGPLLGTSYVWTLPGTGAECDALVWHSAGGSYFFIEGETRLGSDGACTQNFPKVWAAAGEDCDALLHVFDVSSCRS